jgi:hypothetical protein
MKSRKEIHGHNKRFRIEKNKRMTAVAGAVLFVLIIAELVITANLRGMISEHIFVGVLLAGPIIIKMCSTGYRFFKYYRKSPDFVKAGPPNILLRLLAPFLVLMTVLVFISGFGLVLGGHTYERLFIKIHAASVALWLPLLAVHVYAYVRKVPGLISKDWTRKSALFVPGRMKRLGLNVLALGVSGIAAVILTPWKAGGHGHGAPGALILGAVAAVIAVLIAIPLLRITNKDKKVSLPKKIIS